MATEPRTPLTQAELDAVSVLMQNRGPTRVHACVECAIVRERCSYPSVGKACYRCSAIGLVCIAKPKHIKRSELALLCRPEKGAPRRADRPGRPRKRKNEPFDYTTVQAVQLPARDPALGVEQYLGPLEIWLEEAAEAHEASVPADPAAERPQTPWTGGEELYFEPLDGDFAAAFKFYPLTPAPSMQPALMIGGIPYEDFFAS